MIQEDKEILLKDLCARLPYRVKAKTPKGTGYIFAVNTSQLVEISIANDEQHWTIVLNIDTCKPYLRPMASMTEEEKKEIAVAFNYRWSHVNEIDIASDDWGRSKVEPLGFSSVKYTHMADVLDYLNSHHFDYRGLIDKGLALEAHEGMYNFK